MRYHTFSCTSLLKVPYRSLPFASSYSLLAAAPIASLPLACSVTHGHTLSSAGRASHASYWWYWIGRLSVISMDTAYCDTIYGMRWYSWAWSRAWPHAPLYYNGRIMTQLNSVTYLGVRKSSLSYSVISTSQIVIIIYYVTSIILIRISSSRLLHIAPESLYFFTVLHSCILYLLQFYFSYSSSHLVTFTSIC